jgi:two-component system cell cycle response regulator
MATPDLPRCSPIITPSNGFDRSYAVRVNQLTRLTLDEAEAAELWLAVAAHRKVMSAQLGRDVGMPVAMLDFAANLRASPMNIHLVAADALEQLEQNALVDRVTGLYNRAYFDAQLSRECERRRRYGSSTALLLLDLDHFKMVNDTYGHRGGDEVLRDVSTIVRETLRAADLPFRFGGDEVAALLTDADSVEAASIAERVRAGVADHFHDWRVPVTTSIGVAMLLSTPAHRMEEDAFERADRALYAAKSAGGDRVIRDEASDILRV